MREYFKGIKQFPVKLIPLAVCAMIFAASISIYVTVYNKNEMDAQIIRIEKDIRIMEWRVVKNIIEHEYSTAKRDSKINALEIEYSIRANYPNLSILEDQFAEGIYTEEFNNILGNVLNNNDDFRGNYLALVGTRNHLITKFSNSRDNMLKGLDTEGIVPWATVASLNSNPKLTENAITAILDKSNDVVFTQSNPSISGNVEKVENISILGIKQIYSMDGLAGLRDLSLLAPAYITDKGDIFGVDDSTFLKNNDNHKIIIINTIDLGNLIDNNMSLISQTTSTLDNLYNVTKDQGHRNILQSVLWVFIFFLLSILMMIVYNGESAKGHLKEDVEKGDVNRRK